ncbi:MAG: hypothetical protein HQK79_11420 [Desulfobacterales bacterium]|nr:hypothetical protein [Desulfobacterales bacterium]
MPNENEIIKYFANTALEKELSGKPYGEQVSLIIQHTDKLVGSIKKFVDTGKDKLSEAIDDRTDHIVQEISEMAKKLNEWNQKYTAKGESIPDNEIAEAVKNRQINLEYLGAMTKTSITLENGQYEESKEIFDNFHKIVKERGLSENFINGKSFNDNDSFSVVVYDQSKTDMERISKGYEFLIKGIEAEKEASVYHKNLLDKAISGCLNETGKNVEEEIEQASKLRKSGNRKAYFDKINNAINDLAVGFEIAQAHKSFVDKKFEEALKHIESISKTES